jgi:hypothetical protein
MDAIELLQYSVGNAFAILDQVVADLTQRQADWTPPGIANPIGATYWHVISSVDDIVHEWMRGEEPLRTKGDWQERALTAAVPEPGPGDDYLKYMQTIRVDIKAVRAYSDAVAEAVHSWLASLKPEELGNELETPIGKLAVGKVLETFVIWHVNAHCGEISALKGCLGRKGYPF